MTLVAIDGRPNLGALPVLLLWLYPDKLPIAYSVHVTERPELPVWTIVGLNRIEITQHEGEVAARLQALRAACDTSRRLDLLPTKPLPRTGD
jgi:hypothetical protein